MSPVQIVGRSSSHFTRLTRIFAEELGVAYELVPIYDMYARDPAMYANNPALKLPILRMGSDVVFGSENICRTLAERADDATGIVWPEQLHGHVSRNAQELVWHCMAAQVQLVLGTQFAKLPADNFFFAKGREGFEGALAWLNQHLPEALQALPPSRQLSMFEASLFCLIEHLDFRKSVPVDHHTELQRFARTFGERASAQRTVYEFNVAPAA